MKLEIAIKMFVTSVLLVNFVSAHDVSNRSRRNALRRRHRSRMPSWLSQIDRSSTEAMSRVRDMSAFIPDVPSENEVDCQIEYEVVRAVGGRCVRLGGVGRPAVCQSGMYLDVQNADCENILRVREAQSQQDESSQD